MLGAPLDRGPACKPFGQPGPMTKSKHSATEGTLREIKNQAPPQR